MKKCLLCNQMFAPVLSLNQLLSWRKWHEEQLCHHCLAQFEFLPTISCKICSGKLLQDADKQSLICSDCRRWQKIYGNNVLYHQAVYLYNQAFHDLMVNYKRYGDYVLCYVLQDLCYKNLAKIKADYYVPIPPSASHIAERQFDTVSAIYGDLVNLTAILGKIDGQQAQGEKNRKERLQSKQSFFIKAKYNIDLNMKKVLLLDDIYTTGRTLYHARDAVLATFPKAKISSFSVCR